MISIEEYLQNPIKRHIIGQLLKKKSLKYSELMPEEVDNVLFNYHLQHLVKNGLLDKRENYYSLNVLGMKLTANITDSGLYFPKFVCRYRMYLINDDKVLLMKRTRTCWIGDITGLSSKVVMGTGIEERANVRMKEKAGIDTRMKWVGTIRTLAFNSKKDLIDDSMYFICYSTSYRGKLKEIDDNDSPLSWYSIDEAIKFEETNKGSGDKTVEVLKRFKTGNFTPFAFEEYIQAESI